MSYNDKFAFWKANVYDEEIRNELNKLEGDEVAKENCFFKDLSFGQRRIYRLKHCAYENNFVYFGAKNRIDRVSERGTQTVRKRIKHYRSIHCREYYCRKEKPGHFSDQTAGLSKKAKIKRI